MYLDVHGLAFETSIYNRKDQSGICISAFRKMQAVPMRTTVRLENRETTLSCGNKANTCMNKSWVNTQSVVQLLRSRCRVWALILHTDNALFGIILYDRETLCLQLTLQASPHHTATHRSECSFAAFLDWCVADRGRVALATSVVRMWSDYFLLPVVKLATASQHTHRDAFNCFQSSHTTSTKDMGLASL